MNDVILDSSVVAKWVLPEPDSVDALDLISEVLPEPRISDRHKPGPSDI